MTEFPELINEPWYAIAPDSWQSWVLHAVTAVILVAIFDWGFMGRRRS